MSLEGRLNEGYLGFLMILVQASTALYKEFRFWLISLLEGLMHRIRSWVRSFLLWRVVMITINPPRAFVGLF